MDDLFNNIEEYSDFVPDKQAEEQALQAQAMQEEQQQARMDYEEAIRNNEIVPEPMTPEDIFEYLKEFGTKEDISNFLEWIKGDEGQTVADTLNEIRKIKNNALVVQSNELAEASQNLTAVELRIVYNLIGLLNPQTETDFISTKVYIKDLAKICEFDPKSAYGQIDKACTNIMRKPIIINTKDRNGKRITLRRTWFIQLDTFEGEGYIQFKFHPDLRDELLQFHKYGRGYVSTKGNVLNKLSDLFPMRFFNLMIKNLKMKTCEYTIEQIIVMFQLEGKYLDKRTGKTNVSLLIKRVVEPSIEKINSITDLHVEFKPVKVGRKVESVRFFISTKNTAATAVTDIDIPTTEESVAWMQQPAVSKMLNDLKKHGFSETYRSPILGKFTNAEDFLAACNKAIATIAAIKNNPKAKTVQNPGAMMFKTIMDYDPNTERFFAAEEKANQQAQETKARERKTNIAAADTWETIIALASKQTSQQEAITIIKEGAKKHPDIFEKFKKAYELTYPGDTYEIQMEISRIIAYGAADLKKTPKVDYSLIKPKQEY